MLDAITNRLYILFGYYDNTLGPQNVPLIALNVTDPAALSFIDLTQETAVVPGSSSNGTVTEEIDKKNNSATIGGAVGGAIGVS